MPKSITDRILVGHTKHPPRKNQRTARAVNDPLVNSLLSGQNLRKVHALYEAAYGPVVKEAKTPLRDTKELIAFAEQMLMPLLITKPEIRDFYNAAFIEENVSFYQDIENMGLRQVYVKKVTDLYNKMSGIDRPHTAAVIAQKAIALMADRLGLIGVNTKIDNLPHLLDNIRLAETGRLDATPEELASIGNTGNVLRGIQSAMSKVESDLAGSAIKDLRKLLPTLNRMEALVGKENYLKSAIELYRGTRSDIASQWKAAYGNAVPTVAERKLMSQIVRAEFELKQLDLQKQRLARLQERIDKAAQKDESLKKTKEDILRAKEEIERDILRYKDSAAATMRYLNNPAHPVLIGELGKLHFDEEIANAINKEVSYGNIGAFNDAMSVINSINVMFKGFQASADLSFLAITGLLSSYAYPNVSTAMLKNVIKQVKDPDMYYRYLDAFNTRASALKLPTADQWITNYGMHFSHGDLPGQELSTIVRPTSGVARFADKATEAPVAKQVIGFSSAAFSRMGNILRLEIANALAPVYIYPGMPKNKYDAALRDIAEEVNLLTGFSNKAFGDIGGPTGQIAQISLFAARWFASQFQVIGDAATKWKGPRGAIAREALFKMLAYGSLLTIAMNDSLDQETVMDPTDPNFMRIRAGEHDISLFGPWDSLARGLIKAASSVPGVPGEGDPTYLLESRLSPVASIATDITRQALTGSTGDEKYGGSGSVMDSWYWLQRVLPFSTSQILEEVSRMDDPDRDLKTNLIAGAVSFLSSITGLKASPLSAYERYKQMMIDDGIDIEDPLQVRLWKQQNIDKLYAIDAKQAVEYITRRAEFEVRKRDIDEEFKLGSMTIDEWYQRIKRINEEWADVLDQEFSSGKADPTSDKQRMIRDYQEINTETFKTGIADFDLRNKMMAQFIDKWGLDGLQYVESYLLSGKSEIEQQRSIAVYYLSRVAVDGKTYNYFDLPRMNPDRMIGRPDSMSEQDYDDMLSNMRTWASNYKAGKPGLEDSYITALVRDNIDSLLDRYGGGSDNWSSSQVQRLLIDISNYPKDSYRNKLIDKIRSDYPYFTRLLDTNATWDVINGRITPTERSIIDSYLSRITIIDTK